jgi:inner membrane protein
VGAGLARSGLGRRTAWGTLTLLIGANLPDVDVVSYWDGPLGDLAFRRGWTHGIPALIVWPFLLTGAILLLDRCARRVRHIVPARYPREVLRLSAIAIASHPVLDTLNTYGVRWLMPFDGRWFYGDTLFIVDPWMWLLLGLGLGFSRGGRDRAARLGLAAAAAYVLVMVGVAVAGRRLASAELAEMGGGAVRQLLVAPAPADPFTRRVVARQADGYRTATFRWLTRPHIDRTSVRRFPAPNPDDPALLAAAGTVPGRRFLGWARFPMVEVEPRSAGAVIHLVDLRYRESAGPGFAAVSVPLPAAPR